MNVYARIPAWVFRQHTGESLRLYCALASFADSDRTCYPKRKSIAERASGLGEALSEAWVTRHMKALIDSGAVQIVTRTGRWQQYLLPESPPVRSTSPPLERESRSSESHAGAGVRGSLERESDLRFQAPTLGGEGGALPSAVPVLQNSPINTPMNSARARQADDWHPSFLAWWNALPACKKANEGKARQLWRDMKPEDRQAALERVAEYAAIVNAATADRQRFFFRADSWLRDRHWNDSLEAWEQIARDAKPSGYGDKTPGRSVNHERFKPPQLPTQPSP